MLAAHKKRVDQQDEKNYNKFKELEKHLNISLNSITSSPTSADEEKGAGEEKCQIADNPKDK